MDDPFLSDDALQAFSHALGGLLGEAPAPEGARTLDDVRRFLIGQIDALLSRNPAMLLSILYRVDVAERDVKRVFSDAAPGELALQLADLLIARQLQKLRLRRKYAQGEHGG